jgi:hypothetical protein
MFAFKPSLLTEFIHPRDALVRRAFGDMGKRSEGDRDEVGGHVETSERFVRDGMESHGRARALR